MNVLFLCRLYKPHVGGVEKHVAEISKILSRHHKITIITEQSDSATPEYEEDDYSKIYRIPVLNVSESQKKFVIWNWFWGHRDLIKNSEIIHVHDVFFWLLPFKILFPLKKIFITFHGYEGNNPPTFKQKLWHRLAEKLTLGNICIGDFHRKWYDTRPNFVSYGGVSAKITQLQKKNPTAIFIGRLSEDTGIMDYLQAIKQLNIPLDVYGSGQLFKVAKKYVAVHNLPVKFFGFIPDADRFLPKYSLAFVSRYLTILEALRAKIPVVAHYNNEIKFDYLTTTPFRNFINVAHTPDELSDVVNQIKSNPVKQEKQVVAGYNWSKTQSWETVASTYENLWSTSKLQS